MVREPLASLKNAYLPKPFLNQSFAFQPQLIWFDRQIYPPELILESENQGKTLQDVKVKRQLTWFANVQE